MKTNLKKQYNFLLFALIIICILGILMAITCAVIFSKHSMEKIFENDERVVSISLYNGEEDREIFLESSQYDDFLQIAKGGIFTKRYNLLKYKFQYFSPIEYRIVYETKTVIFNEYHYAIKSNADQSVYDGCQFATFQNEDYGKLSVFFKP